MTRTITINVHSIQCNVYFLNFLCPDEVFTLLTLNYKKTMVQNKIQKNHYFYQSFR